MEKQIKKEVYALAKDRDTLSMCDAQLEFKFDFKIEAFVFVDEFWRNYFYAIECIKKNLGLPTRLGGAIQDSERLKLV